MAINPNFGPALRFIAQEGNRDKLKIVIDEFQKGLKKNGNTVPGTPDKATVQSAIPSLHSIKQKDWDEWKDGENGTNQKIILKLLQQLSLLNWGNPNGNQSHGGQVTDKT